MKHTFLKPALGIAMSFLTLNVWAQPTTSATTPPEYSASKLISLYSDAYTQNVGWNFGEWGSGTSYEEIQIGSDKIAKFTTTDLGYFGWEFTSDANAAAMTNLHLDIWMEEETTFQLFPICRTQPSGEKYLEITTQAGEWTSVDLDLDDYRNQDLDLSGIYQFKFAELRNTVIYIDNVYFYNSSAEEDTEKPYNLSASLVSVSYFSAVIACSATDDSGAVNFTIEDTDNNIQQTSGGASGSTTEITINNLQPGTTYSFTVSASDMSGNVCDTEATVEATTLSLPESAPAPTQDAGKVLSIYSDAYTAATTFIVGSWEQSTSATECELGTNDNAYLLTNFNYLGWELNGNVAPFDASNMDYLHIDIFTPDATSFKITPIWGNGNESQQDCTPLALNTWNSFDIPLSDFTGIDLEDIYQIKMVTESTGTTVFVDNVYLWETDGTTTSIQTADNQPFLSVKHRNGQMEITLSEQGDIQIFNALGACIYTTTARNATVSLPAGVYIVRSGNCIQKIAMP